MNKRKKIQAARTNSRGRKRIMREMKGGRVVVATKEHIALLSLMKPQLPIRLRLAMEKQVAAVEAANKAAGLAPVTPPVIDLNAPYTPGPSTVEMMMEAPAVPPKVHLHERERARRLRQRAAHTHGY